jgi:hypothetical protein
MEQDFSSDADICSLSQEILLLLGNPEVYYSVHKLLVEDSVLRHMNPVFTLTSYSF